MFECSRQGVVHVIRGSEPITEPNVSALVDVLSKCTAVGQPRVVLDLEAVPHIDSCGLELLLSTSERFQQRGGQLQLAAPNALCDDILRITGVGEQLRILPDVTEAVRSFAQ